jgi:hypothetical protein
MKPVILRLFTSSGTSLGHIQVASAAQAASAPAGAGMAGSSDAGVEDLSLQILDTLARAGLEFCQDASELGLLIELNLAFQKSSRQIVIPVEVRKKGS